MKSLNSGLPRKVARWRLWNLPATVGAQCTSNLEQVWIGLNWFVILSSPDVEVGKEGIEQLGELWLVMILRLRDPELKACTKIMMSLKRGNISQHPWHNHSPVYWVSAAAWSTVVVENPTILGVEVAVDTILTKQLFKLSKNHVYLKMQFSLRLHVHDNLRRTCKAAISATDTDRGRLESPSRRLLETIRQLFTILPFIVFLYRVRVV